VRILQSARLLKICELCKINIVCFRFIDFLTVAHFITALPPPIEATDDTGRISAALIFFRVP
jgi:hypothetical protein